MAILEVETFSLNPGVDASHFRNLDEQMQEWCYLNRPGLARRTTARNEDGSYLVITLFGDAADAIPFDESISNPTVTAWVAAVSGASRKVAIYSLL